MPSNQMDRYNIDLYHDQSDEVNDIINKHNIKRVRFFRECVAYVTASKQRTKTVIKNCKPVNYYVQ